MSRFHPHPGSRRPEGLGPALTLILLTALAWMIPTAPLSAAPPPHANKRGNVLIADQFNNRVIEVDPATGAVAAISGTVLRWPGRPRS